MRRDNTMEKGGLYKRRGNRRDLECEDSNFCPNTGIGPIPGQKGNIYFTILTATEPSAVAAFTTYTPEARAERSRRSTPAATLEPERE